MATVALIGADGAGKTTIARRLERTFGRVPIKYLYMGTNPEAMTHALPTTRLGWTIRRAIGSSRNVGPPGYAQPGTWAEGRAKRAVVVAIEMARLAKRLADEWYLQLVAWIYQALGYVVVCDRHFFADYYAHDIDPSRAPRSLASRLHGLILRRFYPRPDLLVVLDAPAEVLFERKREGTIHLIERRRQEYFRLRPEVRNFAVVDATLPPDEVLREVRDVIEAYCAVSRHRPAGKREA